tara:strand:- start:439 stop:1278 length:840 start_codon:yes stop_codon:yes gene_type:complete
MAAVASVSLETDRRGRSKRIIAESGEIFGHRRLLKTKWGNCRWEGEKEGEKEGERKGTMPPRHGQRRRPLLLPATVRPDLDLTGDSKLHSAEGMDRVLAEFEAKCCLGGSGDGGNGGEENEGEGDGGDGGACVLWKSTREKDTYGNFKINGTYQKSHRLSYHWFRGEIPDGYVVRHMCRRTAADGADRRACVNPAHLEIGTLQDNNADQAEARKIQAEIASRRPNKAAAETLAAQQKLDAILEQVRELQTMLRAMTHRDEADDEAEAAEPSNGDPAETR